jgi:hypothetical protein
MRRQAARLAGQVIRPARQEPGLVRQTARLTGRTAHAAGPLEAEES